jgi:hypothetical protein
MHVEQRYFPDRSEKIVDPPLDTRVDKDRALRTDLESDIPSITGKHINVSTHGLNVNPAGSVFSSGEWRLLLRGNELLGISDLNQDDDCKGRSRHRK